MTAGRKILFTEHALFQIKARHITRRQVLECLQNPDVTIKQSAERYRTLQITHQPKKKYLLVVIYDMNPKSVMIVTAFLTSKLNKYI